MWYASKKGGAMQSLHVPMPPDEQLTALREIYRTTRAVRLRTRAQMVLLAVEQHLGIAEIAVIVRCDGATVRRWLKRWMGEGIDGLSNRHSVGVRTAEKLTSGYKEQLLACVRLRPRALEQDFSLWTLRRLAEYMNQQTGILVSYESVRTVLKAGGIVLSRPQHTITSPDPAYKVKKRRLKRRVES
jgi:transposase